jgi:hypothetical protein
LKKHNLLDTVDIFNFGLAEKQYLQHGNIIVQLGEKLAANINTFHRKRVEEV